MIFHGKPTIIFLTLLLLSFFLVCPAMAQTTATITITGVIKECPNDHPLVKPPIARFSVYPAVGRSPLKVMVKDQSLRNPTRYFWSFGDGTYSNQKNPPTHEYTKPGFHKIQLTVWNSAGKDTATQFVYVMPRGWWWYDCWRH